MWLLCLHVSTDRVGFRVGADTDIHFGGPVVRHMSPAEVPFDNNPREKSHRCHLDHLTPNR